MSRITLDKYTSRKRKKIIPRKNSTLICTRELKIIVASIQQIEPPTSPAPAPPTPPVGDIIQIASKNLLRKRRIIRALRLKHISLWMPSHDDLPYLRRLHKRLRTRNIMRLTRGHIKILKE